MHRRFVRKIKTWIVYSFLFVVGFIIHSNYHSSKFSLISISIGANKKRAIKEDKAPIKVEDSSPCPGLTRPDVFEFAKTQWQTIVAHSRDDYVYSAYCKHTANTVTVVVMCIGLSDYRSPHEMYCQLWLPDELIVKRASYRIVNEHTELR